MTKKYTDNVKTIINRIFSTRKGDLNLIQNTLRIVEGVESTHYGLSKLVLMMYLADIANKTLLVIGSSGVGKSKAMEALYDNITRSKIYLDTITIGGLRHVSKTVGFDNVSILVDDLSKGLTDYSQLHTVVILAELTHTGSFKRYTGREVIEIGKFRGSAIINLQPLLFRKLIRFPEYETDIRDKTIRFYQIRYPLNPVITKPGVDVKTRYGVESVSIPDYIENHESFQNALYNFSIAFTLPRALQHLRDLLKAHALLNGRDAVSREDVYIVEWLSKNFRLEQYIFYKEDLEGDRDLDVNLLPLLGMFNSYGKFSVNDLMRIFQVRKSMAYEILIRMHEYCDFISGSSEVMPKPAALEILLEVGEWMEYQ